MIKESLDVDTLGVLDTTNTSISSLSPFSSPSPPPKTPHIGFQPATPTVVPPTPSPNSRSTTASSSAQPRSSSSSCSGQEVFYDAQEDTDLQTKRRSMYRSPGTASSPDLATLLRKSKAKEAANNKDKARGGKVAVAPGSTAQLTPNRLIPKEDPTSTSRTGHQRPSTSSSAAASPHATPSKGRFKNAAMSMLHTEGISSPEWVHRNKWGWLGRM